jgi:hypothetical protein
VFIQKPALYPLPLPVASIAAWANPLQGQGMRCCCCCTDGFRAQPFLVRSPGSSLKGWLHPITQGSPQMSLSHEVFPDCHLHQTAALLCFALSPAFIIRN